MRTKVVTYTIQPLPAGWNAQDVVGGINFCLNAVAAITPIEWVQVPEDADLRFSFSGKDPVSGDDLPTWVSAATKAGVITYQPTHLYSTQTPTPAGADDLISVT